MANTFNHNGKVVITDGGNVGIGTTSPGSKLHIYGSGQTELRIGSSTANTNSLLSFYEVSTASWGIDAGQANGSFFIKDLYNTRTVVTLNNAGNVGIGTTSPSSGSRLQVEGNIFSNNVGGNSFSINSAGANYGFILNNSANTFSLGYGPSLGTVGSSVLTWNSSGNVGIGTTIPGSRLQVTATSNSATTVDNGITILNDSGVNNCIAGIRLSTYGNSDGGLYPKQFIGAIRDGAFGAGKGSIVFCNRDAADTSVVALSDEKMRILPNGNVGIGTAAPDSLLEVNGRVSIRGANELYFGQSTSAIGSWTTRMYASGSTHKFNANQFIFNNEGYGGSEFMRITSAGNIGVNTTTPYAGTNVTSVTINATAYPVLGFQVNGSRTAEVIGYSNHLALNTPGFIALSPGDAEAVRVTTAGNVGIGTTSPYEKLEVNGAISATGAVNSSSGQGHSTTLAVSSGISYLYAVDWGAEFKPLSVQGKTIDLGTGTGSTSSRLHITNGGDVGIGTTSPDAIFHVAKATSSGVGGQIVIDNPSSSAVGNIAELSFLTDAGASGSGTRNARIIAENENAGNGAANMQFHTWSGAVSAERMRITSAGNVGIGTTSPKQKLDVAGAGGKIAITNTGTTDYSELMFYEGASLKAIIWVNGSAQTDYAGANSMNIWQGSNAPIVFYTNGTNERMRITGAGNVGIGTSAPDTPLSSARGIVINSGASNDVQIRMQNNTTGSAGSDGGLLSISGSQMYLWNYEASNLIFGTSNSERMRIDSSGNIGIGTTSISYRVDISGDARILSGSLGVGVAPNATDGRIDASNDIVAYSTSDQRLKENVTPIENALDKVKTLTGVEFDWKEETAHVHGYHGHDVGIIAQDVQAVIPEAVRTNDSGYLSVRYEKMIALLIEGMKEQQNQIDELKAKLDGLTR